MKQRSSCYYLIKFPEVYFLEISPKTYWKLIKNRDIENNLNIEYNK